MYSKLFNRFIVFFALANLAGCAFTQNNESAEINTSSTTQVNYDLASMRKIAEQKSTQNDANGNQFTPLQHHKTLANYVEQMALDLVDTLEFESDTNTNINIAVTTLVDLDSSLTKSNQLGNQISETLIHQLQKFGYGVVDFKTTETIDVNSRGDFVLSRDIAKLNEDQMASHVLAGTLIYRRNGVAVNARVINIDTKQVVATSRKLIPLYVLNKEDIYLSSN